MIDSQRVMARTQDNLMLLHRIPLQEASPAQLHMALGRAVMEEIAPLLAGGGGAPGRQAPGMLPVRRVPDRPAGVQQFVLRRGADQVGALFEAQGAPLAQMEDIEDAALGNGGLGRLAACYLDSAAALDLPLVGYGLRYRYGQFKQLFQDSRQKEEPDDWTRRAIPGACAGRNWRWWCHEGAVGQGGATYDMPVARATATAWWAPCACGRTKASTRSTFDAFNAQRYAQASKDKTGPRTS